MLFPSRLILTVICLLCCLAASRAQEASPLRTEGQQQATLIPKLRPPENTLLQRVQGSSACGGPINQPCSSNCERRIYSNSGSFCMSCRSCGNGCGNASC